MDALRNFIASIATRSRSALRSLAVRFGGLPHSVGTVDSPPPEVAHDITALWVRNLRSSTPVVDPGAPEVVNMTTHGARLRDVWLAIESIARGTARPARMILWLNEPERQVPWRLRRLKKRGLEVIFTPAGLGVHTKYWPYLTTQNLDRPLVLSDDDIVYPPTWLETLRREYSAASGEHVVAYRAHVVGMITPEEFAPYVSWAHCRSAEARFTHLATSVSGQILPPALQSAILSTGTEFLALTPTNDDIWLHRCGVLAGIPTRQVSEHQQHWWFIPGSQTSGLNGVNVAGGANDLQMASAHNARTRELLWRTINTPAQESSGGNVPR